MKGFPWFLTTILLIAGIVATLFTIELPPAHVPQVVEFENLDEVGAQAVRRAPGRYFTRVESSDSVAVNGFALISQDTATNRQDMITMAALDGRYIDNDTVYQTLTFSTSNILSISGGNSVDIGQMRGTFNLRNQSSTQPTLWLENGLGNTTILMECDDGVGDRAEIIFDNNADGGQFLDGWRLWMDGPSGDFNIGNHLIGTIKMKISNATEEFTFYDDVTITGRLTVGSIDIISGSGSPEGSVTAPVGSTYHRTDGGANTTLYVKESGSGNTGWIAK